MLISTYNAATNGSQIADIEFLTVWQISQYLRGYNDCIYEEDDISLSEMHTVYSIFRHNPTYTQQVATKNYINL